MSKTTPLFLTTLTLSKAADAILDIPGTLSKPAILTALARAIAGPKHDWGYLTKATGPIVARDARAVVDQIAPATPAVQFFYQMDERDDWGRGISGPFPSRAACLAAIAADNTWKAEEYPVHEVLDKLATQNEFLFFSSDESEEYENASPYSLTIIEVKPTTPIDAIADMPIVGYQITHPDGVPYDHEGEEWYHASFEMFATIEDAQKLIATLDQPQLNLVAWPIRAGEIEDPAWV